MSEPLVESPVDPFAERHPGTRHVLKFFDYDRFPEEIKPIGWAFHDLAHGLVAKLPDDPELVAGLRKLMEARNCMIRLAFDQLHGE